MREGGTGVQVSGGVCVRNGGNTGLTSGQMRLVVFELTGELVLDKHKSRQKKRNKNQLMLCHMLSEIVYPFLTLETGDVKKATNKTVTIYCKQ